MISYTTDEGDHLLYAAYGIPVRRCPKILLGNVSCMLAILSARQDCFVPQTDNAHSPISALATHQNHLGAILQLLGPVRELRFPSPELGQPPPVTSLGLRADSKYAPSPSPYPHKHTASAIE